MGFIFLYTCYQGQNVWKAPCIMLFTKLIFEKPKIFIHIFCFLGLSAQLNILLHLYLPSPNIDYQGVCRAGVNSYLKILTHVFLATVGINFFQLSFLYVIGSYIFHFNIIIGRGCLSYDAVSCQSNNISYDNWCFFFCIVYIDNSSIIYHVFNCYLYLTISHVLLCRFL